MILLSIKRRYSFFSSGHLLMLCKKIRSLIEGPVPNRIYSVERFRDSENKKSFSIENPRRPNSISLGSVNYSV